MSTNVTHLDFPLSINTWLTSVMMMLTVQTPKDLTTAHVWRDTLAQGSIAQVIKRAGGRVSACFP